jgi:hypothetical protein
MGMGKLPFKRSFVYREYLTLRIDEQTKDMEKRLKARQVDTPEILRAAVRACLEDALRELSVSGEGTAA